MPYRTMGRIHAYIARIAGGQAGQGTVEYVGLLLLLVGLLAGVITAARGLSDGGVAKSVAAKLKETIESVGVSSKK
jgi:uncharacterized membrane protein